MPARKTSKAARTGQSETALRRQIIAACLRMNAEGINQGTSGNVSLRWKDGLLITPSGLAYAETEPADIVFLPLEPKAPARGRRKPSSEWRFHRDILAARPEVGAVVHTHSTYATAYAVARRAIPAHHYMIAAAGGPTIPCARYATVASQALSDNALKALQGRNACLLANHGVIALGPTLEKALWLAAEVEVLAKQSILARLVGTPKVLSDAEIGRTLEIFKGYGPGD